MALSDCKLLQLPKVSDPRGNLTFIEAGKHIDFTIKRVYFLYDVPAGAMRAGHAHKALRQLLIATSGSFDIVLDDGTEKQTRQLNRPFVGLYLCPGIWREITNFSSGAVCMVLASEPFSEDDYLRDYEDFLAFVRKKK